MVEPAVTVALETIGSLLTEEGKFLFGVRDQVEELRAELEVLQSFLKDANARKHEHETVCICVSQAKRLAYEAEDIIEEYAIKVASKRGEGFGKVARRVACIAGEGIAIHKVGNKIGKIKTRIVNLKNNLQGYGITRIIEAQPSSATIEKQRRLRTTYAYEVDEYFVGMEDDVSKIVTWVTEVTEDDKIRRVISICGVGGLGKTTIARKVFNHRQVKMSFECFAWVSVTQQFQVKILLHDILLQIVGDKVGDLGEEALIRKLHNELENKKCFFVLDDIWNLVDWESLRKAFSISKGSSKILLTTRTRDVAKVADLQHEPKLLDEKDGWDLLTKIAFNQEEEQGNKLSETVELVGREMLRKCEGLPLAISLLGGILKTKDPLIEWDKVNKKIVSVLAFSYDDLPSYLRPCFLYMGCFREDEEIDVMRLYQLWMAEGLIPASRQGPKETLLDAASDLLDELISRNMVQPQQRDVLTDKKKPCRLHDRVRDLCLTKGKEEQFLEVKSKPNENGEVAPDICRQAILVDQRENGIEISRNATYFRALIINNSNSRTYWEMPRFNFKSLRSLILDGCNFKDNKFPNEIRDMIHLRYLSLRDFLTYGKLPAFIGDLQYIQTLDLRDNKWLRLPNIFHKMKRLRCLYLPDTRRQPKNGKRLEFHGLNELEVLEGFHSKYDQCTHLSELVNLRRFSATISGYDEFTHLSELVNLRRFSATIVGYEDLYRLYNTHLLMVQYISITFREGSGSDSEKSFPEAKKLFLCPSLHSLILQGPIGKFIKFPRYEPQFWPDLISLVLYETKFEEDPMPFLQELPNLMKLVIWKDAYVGKEMHCSSKAFPKLRELHMAGLENIEKWRVDAGAFPNLEIYIGGLIELEVLEFHSKYHQCIHLSELVNLRRFSVTIWDYDALSTTLVQLSSLLLIQYVSLTFKPEGSESNLQKSFPDVRKLLLCPYLHNLELHSPIGNLPRYEPQFWPDLVSLELCNTEFEEDPMPFLQELPNLMKLVIWKDAYVGKEMHCSSKAFPKLTSLQIVRLRNIEKWRVDAGAFPNLQTLFIEDCNSFEIVPHGLTHITTLTRINVEGMPEEFRIN